VSTALAGRLGRLEAHELVEEASRRAVAAGRSLRDELAHDPRVELPPAELARLLDPDSYLGSADAFVQRALDRYREER
jgi:3-carboxy-cis,cis-muconate cycloisomerase